MKDVGPKASPGKFRGCPHRVNGSPHLNKGLSEGSARMLRVPSGHELWLFCHIRILIVPAKLVIVLEIFQSLLETGTNNSRRRRIQRYRTPQRSSGHPAHSASPTGPLDYLPTH